MRILPLMLQKIVGCILVLSGFISSYGQVSYKEAFPNIGFNVPVEIKNASDGSNRLFVVEQQGTIKVFPNNSNVSNDQVNTFLDITEKVSYNAGQEIGLLGLAFHPQFENNRYIFVYYIDKPSNYRINIVRYHVSSSDENSVDPNSETIIAQFTKNQPESNHNGGKIEFGPDGYLYISIGDGGGGGDPQGNAQNLNTAFGSILRIDIDLNGNNPLENNPELPNGNYEIPSDNPRVNLDGLDEIYAWGIRNTWKFSFDTAGNLWGADVGQNSNEEINIITKGGNFGWNRFEGNLDYRTTTDLVSSPDTKPLFSYDHNQGDKSITGGYVYSGNLTSNILEGAYIYGDFTTGRVWALSYDFFNGEVSSTLLFRASGQSISSFGEDEAGDLYFSGYGTNAKLFKLTETVTEPVTTAVNGVGEWKSISSGTNGTVQALTQGSDNTIYVGGNFTIAGGITATNLAKITPEGQWETIGDGSNGPIHSVAIAPNGFIYVGGEFTQIGNITANNIAFWNGSVWSNLDEGINGAVFALKFDQEGNLFVGGVFTEVGETSVNNIAVWKDGNWMSLTDIGTNIAGTNNEIRSLAIDEENSLYVGGNFDTAGGISAARIAKWNGSNWSGLGDGTSGFVQAITIVENYLYAGGNFNLAGNTSANRIARWNLTSSTWETLGFGLSGSVNTITSNENYIFIGGDFETASDTGNDNKIVNNIARWSTENGWEALGQDTSVGVNSSISALLLSEVTDKLYVAGSFTEAGSLPNDNIAIWGDNFCTENSITPEYQINGVWDSGANILTLIEGTNLILSILPNTTSFTITLPNGEVKTGNFNLGPITPELAGTYTFSTTLGCVESLELVVNETPVMDTDNDGILDQDDICPNTPTNEIVNSAGCAASQLDTDSDGVVNSLDICPNTAIGAIVNANGCAQQGFPSEQFTISTSANSCATTPNGKSVIVSSSTEMFTATLLKDSQILDTYEFNTILEIENLERGFYEICLVYPETNSQGCYPITIDDVSEGLEIQSALTNDGTSVILNLNGAPKYYINLNGTEIETELNNLTLELNKDFNTLKVRSENSCQRDYEETIVLKDVFIVYPNPITDFVTIDVRYLLDEEIQVSLYAASGKLLHTESYSTENDTITIDTAHLAPGYFFLHLESQRIDKGFKLIK